MNQYILIEKKILDTFNEEGISKLRIEYNNTINKINLGFTTKYLIEINNKFKLIDKEDIVKQTIEKILRQYYLAQVIISFFKKFKHKKLKYIIINDKDLLLHSFGNIYLDIQTNNKIFRFTPNDLKNILIESLGNSDDLIYNPKLPKNPYNNIIFNNYDLTIIYNFLVQSNNNSEVITNFRKSNFKINIFRERYSYFLKKNAIKNYVNNLTEREIIDEFSDLLYEIYRYHSVKYNYFLLVVKNNFKKLKKIVIKMICDYLYITNYTTEVDFSNNVRFSITKRLQSIENILSPCKSVKKDKDKDKEKTKNKYLDNIFCFTEEITLETDPLKLEQLIVVYDAYWKSKEQDLKKIFSLMDNKLSIKPINL